MLTCCILIIGWSVFDILRAGRAFSIPPYTIQIKISSHQVIRTLPSFEHGLRGSNFPKSTPRVATAEKRRYAWLETKRAKATALLTRHSPSTLPSQAEPMPWPRSPDRVSTYRSSSHHPHREVEVLWYPFLPLTFLRPPPSHSHIAPTASASSPLHQQ
jgi:hypothetical protein